MKPARAGSAVTRAPGLSVNRTRHERPVDDAVSVIRVDGEDGSPLAAVISFTAHPITIGGITREWDAEYPGAMRAAFAEARRVSSRCSSRAARATSRRSQTGGSATGRRAVTRTRRETSSDGSSPSRARGVRANRADPDARVAAASEWLELRRRRHAYSATRSAR